MSLAQIRKRMSDAVLFVKSHAILFRNRTTLKRADSLRAVNLLKRVRGSGLRSKTKKDLELKLDWLVRSHADAAQKQTDFLEWAKQRNNGKTPTKEQLRKLEKEFPLYYR